MGGAASARRFARNRARPPTGGTSSSTFTCVTSNSSTDCAERRRPVVSGRITPNGKEIVAREIHALSRRSVHHFVAVNCAAIPNELMESKMFGHQRGAFSGAALARPGLFSLPDRGAIFLDEISEMSYSSRPSCCAYWEDGLVRAVGSDKAVRVDAHVITASNVDLMTAVKRGTFREGFVLPFTARAGADSATARTPLRHPIAGRIFLERNRKRFDGQWTITREAMVHLWSYDWPGNVRELENLMARASDPERESGDRRPPAAAKS